MAQQSRRQPSLNSPWEHEISTCQSRCINKPNSVPSLINCHSFNTQRWMKDSDQLHNSMKIINVQEKRETNFISWIHTYRYMLSAVRCGQQMPPVLSTRAWQTSSAITKSTRLQEIISPRPDTPTSWWFPPKVRVKISLELRLPFSFE
jgi:hypothetical protein